MKIAIYSLLNLGNGGGGEKWIQEVALGLKSRGHEVMVITSKYGEVNDTISERLLEKEVKVFEFDIMAFIKIPDACSFRKIVEMLSTVDVLYFNNAFALNELIVYFIKLLTGTKVIVGNHGAFPEQGHMIRKFYHRHVNRRVCKRFDAQHVVNRERERKLRSFEFRNVHMIPNGVNTTEIKPLVKSGIFTIIFVGSMVPQKGVERFAALVEEINNSTRLRELNKFIIFGSGPLSYIPRGLQERFGNVNYVGYGSRMRLVEAYQTSHLLVVPSRYEEFSIVSLEAQAAGTPVVASNISGPAEIILNNKSGILVDSNIPEDLYESTIYFSDLWYGSRDLYDWYCLNARQNALNYKWDIIIDRIEKMFTDLANKSL